MKYSLYLAGSIQVWEKEFVPKYGDCIGNRIDLFQPGDIKHIPKMHKEIPQKISKMCLGAIETADGVLAYIKDYKSPEGAGPCGTDSCWELGYALGKGKPVIALIEDVDHLNYISKMWMVILSIDAILTLDRSVKNEAEKREHYQGSEILFVKDKTHIEDEILDFLKDCPIGKR